MAGPDDNRDNDGTGDDGENVVRVDFSARRPRSTTEPTTRPTTAQVQQRIADAARLRPSASDLGPERPEKLRMFARLIEQGMTMVSLDARREGVRVPHHLAGELLLNLNFSLRFGIDDFAFDDDGVRASLTFNKVPFFCEIPWSAVFQMTSTVNADRMMWPDSLPAELADLVPPQVRPSSPRPAAPTPAVTPAPVAAVPVAGPSSTEATSAPPDGDGEGPRPPTPRPTLRRVK
jgi:stringent starvation protein B